MKLSAVVFGATRRVFTGKYGNKSFYKGRGCKPTGVHTKHGTYFIVKNRIPNIVVPDLEGFNLKPYVSYRTPVIKGPPIVPEDILAVVQGPVVA